MTRALRVLVMSPTRTERDGLTHLLAEEGQDVAEAETIAGPAPPAGPPPDVIVADVQVPDLDGAEVLRWTGALLAHVDGSCGPPRKDGA